jgi:D-alanyl-D-alanine endopeptidase (penicillin-binding protein 7)
MRSQIPKLIFIVVLVAAAFWARAAHYSVSQSADITNVTGGAGTVGTTVGASSIDSETALADPEAMGGVAYGTSSPTGALAVGAPAPGLSPFARVGNDPAPSLDYHEALIADIASGAIIWGDADGTRWPLASVTKLMTALVATETLNPDQRIAITPTMLAVDPTDATLSVGDTYTVSDLLRIMLLQSSNVAAEALAGVSGRAQFLTAMNARATALGMRNTYYYDSSGLSSANQSTADDLLLLARDLYQSYPQTLAITRMPQATVTNLATGKKVVVKSINDFAGQPDFLGGKTGYTNIADGNLLSIFKYENRPVLVIIMGTDDAARFQNTETLYNWFKSNFK